MVDICASGLQAVALHFGPLSLVQPILVCDLLFAALMAAAVAHRRPDRVMVAGVLCCTGGLTLFQAVARPAGGKASVSPTVLIPLGIFLAAAIVICPIVARFSPKKGTLTDPLVAIGIGIGIGLIFLDERIANGPGAISAEVVGLAVMTVGVCGLAHRSPQIAAKTTVPTTVLT
jgi:drug/metabolite transporter (DMT)-like permease